MLQFPSAAEAEAEVSQRVRSLDGLQIALRTQPHSFVSRFLDCQVRSRYIICVYINIYLSPARASPVC